MQDERRGFFGSRLRVWRTEASPPATLQDIASILGVSVTSIAKIERGELRPPNRDGCEKIAARLGQDPGGVWALAADSLLSFPPYNELRPFVEHLQVQATEARADHDALRLIHLLEIVDGRGSGLGSPSSRLGAWQTSDDGRFRAQVRQPLKQGLRNLLYHTLEVVDGSDATGDLLALVELLGQLDVPVQHRLIRTFLALALGELHLSQPATPGS